MSSSQASLQSDLVSSSEPGFPLRYSSTASPTVRRKWALPAVCSCFRTPLESIRRVEGSADGGRQRSQQPDQPPVEPAGVIQSVQRDKEPLAPLSPEELRREAPVDSQQVPYLGEQVGHDVGLKTLVLDLDETLSGSQNILKPNMLGGRQVEIEGHIHDIFVSKRPGVDEFLTAIYKCYEIVIFTASLAKYADPLMDELDPLRLCSWRLFRESCTLINGSYVKDLSKLGRDLKNNSPNSYGLQPNNAIPIRSWFEDMQDRELSDLVPILDALSKVDDIPAVMRQTLAYEGNVDDDY